LKHEMKERRKEKGMGNEVKRQPAWESLLNILGEERKSGTLTCQARTKPFKEGNHDERSQEPGH